MSHEEAFAFSTAEPLSPTLVLRCALAVVGVALFFTYFDTYAYLAWDAPIPKLWVMAFCGAAAILLALHPHRPAPALRSPFVAWVVLYFLATTLWAVWMRHSPATTQVLHDRYRSIAFLCAFALIFDDPRARRAGVYAVAGATVFASCVNVAHWLGLVEFSDKVAYVAGRAAGFYGNPNESGIVIACGAAIAVMALPRPWRAPLLVASAVGVATTFSRGAAVCVAAVTVWAIVRGVVSKWLALAVFLMIIGLYRGGGTDALDVGDLLNDNTSARVHLAADDSGRAELAAKALALFVGAPILGNGLGATFDWDSTQSSHNMYLNLAADQGIVGLVTFPALLLALVACTRRATGLSLVLLVAGLFSHDLLDHRAVLLAMALASAREATADRQQVLVRVDEEPSYARS